MIVTLSAVSQTTSNVVVTDIKGDTVTLKMHMNDARTILADLLDYEKVDSLLTLYQEKDSVNMEIIAKKDIIIVSQNEQIENYKIQISNSEQIVRNKDSEIGILLARIKELEKDVKKQRRQKRFAIAGAVVGPVVTAIIMGLMLGK